MSRMAEPVVAYVDYLCPYAWHGAEVARWVAAPLGLRFEWHFFSLVQSRQGGRDGRQLWDAPIDPDDPLGAMGLTPFLAGCAARRQGPEAFDRFHLDLLRARHRDGAPFTVATTLQVAEASGLHVPRFERDLADPELRTCLAQDHHQSLAHEVFDTPAFAFAGAPPAHFRLRALPADASEAVRLVSAFRDLLSLYPDLETVRRPAPLRN